VNRAEKGGGANNMVFPHTENIKQSKNIIYKLKVITYFGRAAVYPIDIDESYLGMYSALDKAETEMLRIIQHNNSTRDDDTGESDVIHHFVIQEIALDVPYGHSSYDKRVYDKDGNFYGVCKPDWEPFKGINPEECKFKEKDLVEVLDNGQLRIGIITLLPITPKIASKAIHADQSDNTYNVDFGHGHMERDHSHMPECDIFSPRFMISNDTKDLLIQQYEYLHSASGNA
jgi:hypothetical protein